MYICAGHVDVNVASLPAGNEYLSPSYGGRPFIEPSPARLPRGPPLTGFIVHERTTALATPRIAVDTSESSTDGITVIRGRVTPMLLGAFRNRRSASDFLQKEVGCQMVSLWMSGGTVNSDVTLWQGGRRGPTLDGHLDGIPKTVRGHTQLAEYIPAKPNQSQLPNWVSNHSRRVGMRLKPPCRWPETCNVDGQEYKPLASPQCKEAVVSRARGVFHVHHPHVRYRAPVSTGYRWQPLRSARFWYSTVWNQWLFFASATESCVVPRGLIVSVPTRLVDGAAEGATRLEQGLPCVDALCGRRGGRERLSADCRGLGVRLLDRIGKAQTRSVAPEVGKFVVR